MTSVCNCLKKDEVIDMVFIDEDPSDYSDANYDENYWNEFAEDTAKKVVNNVTGTFNLNRHFEVSAELWEPEADFFGLILQATVVTIVTSVLSILVGLACWPFSYAYYRLSLAYRNRKKDETGEIKPMRGPNSITLSRMRSFDMSSENIGRCAEICDSVDDLEIAEKEKTQF